MAMNKSIRRKRKSKRSLSSSKAPKIDVSDHDYDHNHSSPETANQMNASPNESETMSEKSVAREIALSNNDRDLNQGGPVQNDSISAVDSKEPVQAPDGASQDLANSKVSHLNSPSASASASLSVSPDSNYASLHSTPSQTNVMPVNDQQGYQNLVNPAAKFAPSSTISSVATNSISPVNVSYGSVGSVGSMDGSKSSLSLSASNPTSRPEFSKSSSAISNLGSSVSSASFAPSKSFPPFPRSPPQSTYKNVPINMILNSKSSAEELPKLPPISSIKYTKPAQFKIHSPPSHSILDAQSPNASSSSNSPDSSIRPIPSHSSIVSLIADNQSPYVYDNVPHDHVVAFPNRHQLVHAQPPAGSSPSDSSAYPLIQQSQYINDDHLLDRKQGRRFRRRYNQILRKYSCSHPGCNKSYGSLNHLNTHIVTKKHGNRKSKADYQKTGDQQDNFHGSDASVYPVALDYARNYWYGYLLRPVAPYPHSDNQNGTVAYISYSPTPPGMNMQQQVVSVWAPNHMPQQVPVLHQQHPQAHFQQRIQPSFQQLQQPQAQHLPQQSQYPQPVHQPQFQLPPLPLPSHDPNQHQQLPPQTNINVYQPGPRYLPSRPPI